MSWPEDMWKSYPHPANPGNKQKTLVMLSKLKLPMKWRPLFERRLDEYKQYLQIESWCKAKQMTRFIGPHPPSSLRCPWKDEINLDLARKEARKPEKQVGRKNPIKFHKSTQDITSTKETGKEQLAQIRQSMRK